MLAIGNVPISLGVYLG